MNQELFIDNASRDDIIRGIHILVNPHKDVLIQITANDEPNWPRPKHKFKQTIKFMFDDTEDQFDLNCITDTDAMHLADVIRKAHENQANIVVHCYAGLCRSGAIVEAAMSIGFKDNPERTRIPNTLVKRKVMQALGTYITPETSMFNNEG